MGLQHGSGRDLSTGDVRDASQGPDTARAGIPNLGQRGGLKQGCGSERKQGQRWSTVLSDNEGLVSLPFISRASVRCSRCNHHERGQARSHVSRSGEVVMVFVMVVMAAVANMLGGKGDAVRSHVCAVACLIVHRSARHIALGAFGQDAPFM